MGGRSLGYFSHPSPRSCVSTDTPMPRKDSCACQCQRSPQLTPPRSGASIQPGSEPPRRAHAGPTCGSGRASAACASRRAHRRRFLPGGIFPALLHAEELRRLKYSNDNICFCRSQRSRQVMGKSWPSRQTPTDAWHLSHIVPHNFFFLNLLWKPIFKALCSHFELSCRYSLGRNSLNSQR